MKKNYLYIPLEIFNRELNGMLLLSLVAAKNDWNVVIGGKGAIFPVLEKLPVGVVLLKSIVPGEINIQSKIVSYGHKICSIDAEGLIPSNGNSGVNLRYSKETIAKSDMLFFWGKDQFNQVKNVFPSIVKNGLITGSPIFDYWRYLKKSFKESNINNNNKIILIATSFPYANHMMDSQQPYNAVRHASSQNASQSHFDELFLDGELQEIVYPQFRELVDYIAENLSDYKIILRPHPTENIKPWKKIADNKGNIELQFGGQISDIILNCDVFIHFNSTASIEAHYYNKNVITFVPKVKDKLFNRISRHTLMASRVCSTFKEVVSSIKNNSRSEELHADFELQNIIHNSGVDNIIASSEAIVFGLNKLDIDGTDKVISKIELLFSFNALKIILKNRIVWSVGWLDYLFNTFSGKYASKINFYKYGKVKQGALPEKEFKSKIHKLCPAIGFNENNFKLTKIKSGIFLIESNVKNK